MAQPSAAHWRQQLARTAVPRLCAAHASGTWGFLPRCITCSVLINRVWVAAAAAAEAASHPKGPVPFQMPQQRVSRGCSHTLCCSPLLVDFCLHNTWSFLVLHRVPWHSVELLRATTCTHNTA